MTATSSPPWWRCSEIKISISSCRWRCRRRSCHPHLQQSHHGEDDSTLPLHRRRRGGNKPQIPRNLAWRDSNPKTRCTRKNLLKTMDPHSPPPWHRRRREGNSSGGRPDAAAAVPLGLTLCGSCFRNAASCNTNGYTHSLVDEWGQINFYSWI